MRFSQSKTLFILSHLRLGCRDLVSPKAANSLAHLDSELCWCEPIIEVDENGNDVVIHSEVTWN